MRSPEGGARAEGPVVPAKVMTASQSEEGAELLAVQLEDLAKACGLEVPRRTQLVLRSPYVRQLLGAAADRWPVVPVLLEGAVLTVEQLKGGGPEGEEPEEAELVEPAEELPAKEPTETWAGEVKA